jgi:hypothetical protein
MKRLSSFPARWSSRVPPRASYILTRPRHFAVNEMLIRHRATAIARYRTRDSSELSGSVTSWPSGAERESGHPLSPLWSQLMSARSGATPTSPSRSWLWVAPSCTRRSRYSGRSDSRMRQPGSLTPQRSADWPSGEPGNAMLHGQDAGGCSPCGAAERHPPTTGLGCVARGRVAGCGPGLLIATPEARDARLPASHRADMYALHGAHAIVIPRAVRHADHHGGPPGLLVAAGPTRTSSPARTWPGLTTLA